MYERGEQGFYYMTVCNEAYAMVPMPEGAEQGILRGMYLFRRAGGGSGGRRAQLLGSGPILNEVLRAQNMLRDRYDVAADVWSVTSYGQLRRDGLEVERWNLLHPTQSPRRAYLHQCLDSTEGVIVAASDYMKSLPDSVARWSPRPIVSLGTDGFGRSDSRQALRDFFEVDARYIVVATLGALAREGVVAAEQVEQAIVDLEIDPAKANPMVS